MKKFIVFMISVLACYTVNAQNELSLHGYVRNYTGMLVQEPNDLAIVQNTLDLTFESQTSLVGFKANPFLYSYFDDKLEWGLREAYMDLFFKNMDIRVGKQQIIWGKAEGVFITDVVSPKDLREFLLPDLEEIRMGISAVKFDYFIGGSTFELVWSPVFTPTSFADTSSIWAPQMSFPINPEWDYSKNNVETNLENSELFLRYSYLGSAFDFELVGGYFFFDDPAMHITKQIDPATMQMTSLIVRPEYHRVSMGGGSFSLPISDLVVRGDGAFYSGRYFQTSDPKYSESVINKDYLHYMLGLDYNFKGYILSAQFIQQYILDYEESLDQDEMENTMTFLIKKDFFREKLWVELFSYVGLNNEDALIRPRITYDFSDGFELLIGANIFTGDQGMFGQYDKNDMVYFKVKYSF